jgi:ABC-2 type transport system ATP-binding protein
MTRDAARPRCGRRIQEWRTIWSVSAPSVIQASGLTKRYDGIPAVDRVSIEVRQGEIFGLIGPNGAGKTTTMECIEGLRVPDTGRITVLGLDPFRDVARLQRRVGIQLQEAQLQKRIKVREAVGFWSSLYGTRPADAYQLLEQLGIGVKADAWFMALSGGQKQRLFIALALIHDPELVFLDELTTGLDPQARRAIWDLVRGIRDRGKTVFLTTHLMEEAQRLCDRVAIIDHGRIVDIDSPDELVRRHCPERTIAIETSDDQAAAALARVVGVSEAAREGRRVIVRTRSVEAMTGIIDCLAVRRIAVTDFQTFVPTLEEVFLKLTGHSVRQ